MHFLLKGHLGLFSGKYQHLAWHYQFMGTGHRNLEERLLEKVKMHISNENIFALKKQGTCMVGSEITLSRLLITLSRLMDGWTKPKNQARLAAFHEPRRCYSCFL